MPNVLTVALILPSLSSDDRLARLYEVTPFIFSEIIKVRVTKLGMMVVHGMVYLSILERPFVKVIFTDEK